MGQVDPLVEHSELDAGGVGIESVGGMPGHRGQVDLDAEMEADAGGQVVELVMDRQARLAGQKLDRLLEPDRMTIDAPRPLHHDARRGSSSR